MNEFFEYWDNVLKYWREEDGRIPESQKFWFEEQSHLKLHSQLMPEPYWGDIDNNSVVFVNLNPAGAEVEKTNDTCHINLKDDPSTVCGYVSGNYSGVAKSFYPLEKDSIYTDAAKWWKSREKWIDQFELDTYGLKPFAIEVCPWHSNKWTGGKYQSTRNKYPKIKTYMKEMFGPWLERALKGSKYHLALCVGKEFAESIIPLIWPNAQDITKKVTGKTDHTIVNGNARKFWVFAIDGLGHIICTSAQGSNKIPSSEIFGKDEKEIIEKIKALK